MPRRRTRLLAALLLIGAGLALLGWSLLPKPPARPEPVGLFTSLPLVWGEGEKLGDLLRPETRGHPALAAIAAIGPVQPLDTLEQLGAGQRRLVLAQPRPLSPAENVALDNWVRGGGRLLLFADPLLTAHSDYPVGDPRRPQDVVLLSPILSRWGLELTFDESQPGGLRTVALAGPAMPIDLAGAWRTTNPACAIEGDGLLVSCRIGKGRVIALADAEVLSASDPEALRQPALAALLARTFAQP